MKIANWNHSRALPAESRVSIINRHFSNVCADIWVLTETHELIGPGGDFRSVMSGEPDRESKPGERWAGIWSCYPIRHLTSSVSDTSRCSAALIMHPDIGEIVVYATVLPWLGSEWGGFASAGGAAFEAALTKYSLDWQRLRAAFPNALCVVAGDFNQDLAPYHYYGSKYHRRVLEQKLAAAGLVARTSEANDPINWKPTERHACIDHICTTESSDIRIGSITRWPLSGKPDNRVSDHTGVAIELFPQS